MNILNWFKKQKNEEIHNEVEINQVTDYHPLIGISKILTNCNYEAVESIKLLVDFPLEFEQRYQDWLTKYDFNVSNMPDYTAAFWLTGYDAPYDFGGYIDWKEETCDILGSLEDSIKNKKYDLDLDDVVYDEEDFTGIVLLKINNFLKAKGFILTSWDTGSDSYHIFIIDYQDYNDLVALGKKINVRFFTFGEEIDENGKIVVIEE